MIYLNLGLGTDNYANVSTDWNTVRCNTYYVVPYLPSKHYVAVPRSILLQISAKLKVIKVSTTVLYKPYLFSKTTYMSAQCCLHYKLLKQFSKACQKKKNPRGNFHA